MDLTDGQESVMISTESVGATVSPATEKDAPSATASPAEDYAAEDYPADDHGADPDAKRRVTRRLCRLLASELAAVETYRRLLERAGDQPGSAQVRSIHADHVEAVGNLRRHVLRRGGRPTTAAEAWWNGSGALGADGPLLAEPAVLEVLRDGEVRGVAAYRELLEEDGLEADCRRYVHATVLPRQHHHLSTLRRWMDVQ